MILKLEGAYKDYIWGGHSLVEHYGKAYAGERLAESWELSAHRDGSSIVRGGAFDGMAFSDYILKNPGCLGNRCSDNCLPILIKLIDAEKPLSVQVHPDDDYANQHEGESGKTEMWIVLEAQPGAYIYHGFMEPISSQEVEACIKNHTLTGRLRKIPVKKGDVFFIPAGTVHALGGGVIIVEIQQNANATYRVYDYGRLGDDGKPRELHIEKALDVIYKDPSDDTPPGRGSWQPMEGGKRQVLTRNAIFQAQILSLTGTGYIEAGPDSFLSLFCIDGACRLGHGKAFHNAKKGDSFFIPAGSGTVSIEGVGDFILTSL